MADANPDEPDSGGDVEKLRDRLQRVMTEHAGVLRSSESLEIARAKINDISRVLDGAGSGALELLNLTVVARALVSAALAREESRGAHARTDFPERSPEFAHRIVIR